MSFQQDLKGLYFVTLAHSLIILFLQKPDYEGRLRLHEED